MPCHQSNRETEVESMNQVQLILSVNRKCVSMSPKPSYKKGDRSRLLQSCAGLCHAQNTSLMTEGQETHWASQNPGLVITEAEPFRQTGNL